MAEPGDAQSTGGRARPGIERIHRWQRLRRHAPLAPADELAERWHRGRRVAQARQDGLQVTELLACPARRGFDPLQPRALRNLAERFHMAISRKLPRATAA